MVKKLKYVKPFHRIPERDRQTDGQTDIQIAFCYINIAASVY